MSRHKNFVFGKTLELSVTVNGDSVTQELVSSGEDCIVSFKMDAGCYISPKTLREIADFIDSDKSLRLATEQESEVFISAAKTNPIFVFMSSQSNVQPSYLYIIAEMLANNEGITLYIERVSETNIIAEDEDDEDDFDDDYDDDWEDEDDYWK